LNNPATPGTAYSPPTSNAALSGNGVALGTKMAFAPGDRSGQWSFIHWELELKSPFPPVKELGKGANVEPVYIVGRGRK
jgi:hypothetical protein